MICAEDLFQPLQRERFGDVDPLTAAVIPLTRITFRVFIGHHAGVCFAYRPAGIVLRSNKLEVLSLPAFLARNGGEDFGVAPFDAIRS